jgi:Maf-like protein
MMDQILLTADQVVVYDNKILEKPQNLEEARVFMEGYGLLPCSTVGSIVLTDLTSKRRVQGVDICNIYFDPIPENIIEQLLAEGRKMKFSILFFTLLYFMPACTLLCDDDGQAWLRFSNVNLIRRRRVKLRRRAQD